MFRAHAIQRLHADARIASSRDDESSEMTLLIQSPARYSASVSRSKQAKITRSMRRRRCQRLPRLARPRSSPHARAGSRKRRSRSPGKASERSAVLGREREARAIAARQKLILVRLAAAPHRADGVDHMLGRQAIGFGDARLAGRTAAELAAFGEQLRPGGAMDRAIDPAAAEERRIRRVDDRVERERGDVGLDRR